MLRVTVTELRDNTFHASITVQQDGNEIEIDSRSSDAIAIAVRAQVPIFAADEVIEESAIEFDGEDEEEIVDEFALSRPRLGGGLRRGRGRVDDDD